MTTKSASSRLTMKMQINARHRNRENPKFSKVEASLRKITVIRYLVFNAFGRLKKRFAVLVVITRKRGRDIRSIQRWRNADDRGRHQSASGTGQPEPRRPARDHPELPEEVAGLRPPVERSACGRDDRRGARADRRRSGAEHHHHPAEEHREPAADSDPATGDHRPGLEEGDPARVLVAPAAAQEQDKDLLAAHLEHVRPAVRDGGPAR